MTETQILAALKSRLSGHTWRTFSEDRHPSAHVGRKFFNTDTNPLPVVTVIPDFESASRLAHGMDQISLPLLVIALVNLEDGQQAHAVCRAIFLEMKNLLYAEPLLIDGDPYFLEHNGGGFDYPESLGPADVSIQVNCTATFTTEHEQHQIDMVPNPATWASLTHNP